MPNSDSNTLIDKGYIAVKKSRYGYMTYNKNDIYVGKSFDLYGEFSYLEAVLFEQIVKPQHVVLDVGANIGAFTLLFSQLVGVKGRVLAFEPQRIVHQMLCANVALNALMNVDVYHACVGSTDEIVDVVELNPYISNNFGGISMDLAHTAGSPVPTLLIDTLPLNRCDFMKIDVEGMEEQVLRGAVKTLQTFRPLLYIENDRKEKSASLIDFVRSQGYRIFSHTPALYNPQNFFQCSVNVFGNIVSKNILCVPKESDIRVEGLVELC